MNKDSMNETVFEALFRQAVINNFNEEIESIPSKDQLAKNYSFSPIFEMKMKKVFAKDQRKSFIKMSMNYARKVASIIIVFGIMFFTLLFSPEVRAAVGNVFVEWYEKFTSFTYRTEEAIVETKNWTLRYLPEGYVQNNYEVLGPITKIEFGNNQGDKIRFSYRTEKSITNISVDNEHHKIYNDIILKNNAYCIRAINDGFDNGVLWNIDGYTFSLWGKLHMDELKKIAESIVERN